MPEESEEDADVDMPVWFRKAWAGVYNAEQFISYAENPLETYDEWQVNSVTGESLDDPLLFIRACMELSDATTKKRMLHKKGFSSDGLPSKKKPSQNHNPSERNPGRQV